MPNEESLKASQVDDEKVEVTWEAPDRPYKKRGVQFYFNVCALAILVILILLFFYQYILLAVVLSLLFAGLALATVPAKTISYQITNKGIRISTMLTPWDDIEKYWRENQLGHEVLHVRQKKFPKFFIVVIDPAKQTAIMKAMQKYTEEIDQPKKTWFDRRSDNLVKLVNLGQK